MAQMARHVFVRGRVQGVSFRWSTRLEAQRLGVAGWVRNRADGRVEAHLQGDTEAVDALLEWMGRGPAGARVDEVLAVPAAPLDIAGDDEPFDVRATVSA